AEATVYRSPGLLVRAAGALDALSGGRARLGIGSGYGQLATGTLGSGSGSGSATAPAERTGELLRLAHDMWSEDGLGDATGAERRPPVMVGGTGDARTLPLVARYAEACDLLDTPDSRATLRGKLDILAVHCRKLGRAFSDVDTSISTLVRPDATADELVAHCAVFEGYGLDHVVLVPAGPWARRTLATLAAAAPAIRALGAPRETLPKVTQLDAYRLQGVGVRSDVLV
ncbi:MAG TPA: LLM class flavin-dependent oxidoreductase, partial [Streptomyces sp.]